MRKKDNGSEERERERIKYGRSQGRLGGMEEKKWRNGYKATAMRGEG